MAWNSHVDTVVRQALHCAIDRTMRTDVQEEWENGQGMIAELLARGAQPNKLDGNSRTALTVLKSLLLGPNDRHNGKEQIVRRTPPPPPSFSDPCPRGI